MATHHPSRELIVGYARGALPIGPSLAVGLHLDACPRCGLAVAELEEAEGRRLQSLPGAPLGPEALRDVLAKIDGPIQGVKSPSIIEGLNLPEAIARIGLATPIHLAPATWVAHLNAPRVGGWRTYVFCGPAETALPRHGHLGDELIAVLEGSFHDEREFNTGDFAENKPGFVHDMQVSPDGRLVALISSGGAIDWAPADRSIGALLDI